jgi:hypothetical protein
LQIQHGSTHANHLSKLIFVMEAPYQHGGPDREAEPNHTVGMPPQEIDTADSASQLPPVYSQDSRQGSYPLNKQHPTTNNRQLYYDSRSGVNYPHLAESQQTASQYHLMNSAPSMNHAQRLAPYESWTGAGGPSPICPAHQSRYDTSYGQRTQAGYNDGTWQTCSSTQADPIAYPHGEHCSTVNDPSRSERHPVAEVNFEGPVSPESSTAEFDRRTESLLVKHAAAILMDDKSQLSTIYNEWENMWRGAMTITNDADDSRYTRKSIGASERSSAANSMTRPRIAGVRNLSQTQN